MQSPVQNLLWDPVGQAEHIGSRQPAHNISQCEGLHVYWLLLGAKSSPLETSSPSITLANVRIIQAATI